MTRSDPGTARRSRKPRIPDRKPCRVEAQQPVKEGQNPRSSGRGASQDLPPLLRPDQARLAGLRASLAHLEREYVDTTTLPLGLHTAVLRHSLTAYLLRLAPLADSSAEASPSHHDTTFTRFRDAVEREFTTNHSVSAYADALGCSRRTLVRAVRAATGQNPKGVIDKRVVLEAKRLPAHTDLPTGRVGAAVGFPDSANFSKFFQLHTGTTPMAFRAEMR